MISKILKNLDRHHEKLDFYSNIIYAKDMFMVQNTSSYIYNFFPLQKECPLLFLLFDSTTTELIFLVIVCFQSISGMDE